MTDTAGVNADRLKSIIERQEQEELIAVYMHALGMMA